MIALGKFYLKMPEEGSIINPVFGQPADPPAGGEDNSSSGVSQTPQAPSQTGSGSVSQPEVATTEAAAPTENIPPLPESQTEAGPNPQETPVPAATPPPTTYVFGQSNGFVKKILLTFLVILVLGGIGFGVYKFGLPLLNKFKGGGITSQTTVAYWGLWEPTKIFEQVIADFEKDHPNIKIEYAQQSHKDYRERLASSIARGEGPDIFRFHNTWVPMFKKDLSVVPPDVYDAASFESTFYPVARESLRQGTAYMGIPLEFDGLGLYINEEIFSRAGKEPPKTWDELRQMAKELTTAQVAGVALGRTENVDHWSEILGVMMLQNGANLEKPTGKLAEDALDYFTLFAKTDKVWNERLPSSTLAFANGRVAMIFGPSWRALNIKEINPSLKFKIVPVPQLPETNITWASFWVEGVWEKSQNKKEAWEFLKYLSSKEVMQKLFQAQSQTRLFGEPYSRTDMADLLKTNQYLGAYITQAPASRSWFLCSRTFDNGINDKTIKYFEDAVNAVNQGKASAEALSTASQGIAQILAQYGLSTGVVR